jgi:cytochrome c-type biogenesis protein CcmH/NrfG
MLQGQLEQSPRDMDLWLGLADALIQHANGLLTPSAEMAFNRAAQVAPDHPAPRFFYGLGGRAHGAVRRGRAAVAAGAGHASITEKWRNVVTQAQRMSADMQAAGPRPICSDQLSLIKLSLSKPEHSSGAFKLRRAQVNP